MTQEEPDDMTRKPESKLSLVTTAAESALIPAEDALDAAEQAIRPEPQAGTQTGAVGLHRKPETPEPGLPSPHQDHALNFITEVQLKGDAFKAGRDALAAELEGKKREFAAIKDTMREKFDAELGNLTDSHMDAREALKDRIANMDLGLEIVAMAIEHYNERIKQK